MFTRYVYNSALLLTHHVLAFSLYPPVIPDRLAASFGISIDCLVAL